MKKTIAILLMTSALLLACMASDVVSAITTASTPGLMASNQPTVAVLATNGTAAVSIEAVPLDLTTNYTSPASNWPYITRHPQWRTVPRGHQVFDGVPLEIGGAINLWGRANAEELNLVFAEKRGDIQVHQKFETLYVYHASFYRMRSPDNTPVCSVVFCYADGRYATNKMLAGADFMDWSVNADPFNDAPTAKRSRIAWIGGGESSGDNHQLEHCLTAIANPKPDIEVSTIDLYSCKSATAPCIMAMTVGKAGLMK